MEILYRDDQPQKRWWPEEMFKLNLTSRDFEQFIISCLRFKEVIDMFFVVVVFFFLPLFCCIFPLLNNSIIVNRTKALRKAKLAISWTPYLNYARNGLLFLLFLLPFFLFPIYNGNRIGWSLIPFVIIRVINKIERPRGGCPIC